MVWTAGAYVFSGRPDPTWQVDPLSAAELEDLWSRLGTWSGSRPAVPPLGYRGCYLRDDRNREWVAFRGVVTLVENGEVAYRHDEGCQFERRLLTLAPAGAVPVTISW
jgi:hypothetical protein